MKIRTDYIYPPIPIRSNDWTAVDSDTYDGADDSNCPIGFGATEQEAIDDLKDAMCRDSGADVAAENGDCKSCGAPRPGECRAVVVRTAP